MGILIKQHLALPNGGKCRPDEGFSITGKNHTLKKPHMQVEFNGGNSETLYSNAEGD